VQRCGEFVQWGDRKNLGEAALSAVITFATIGAIGGLVLGFYCVPWPLIVIPNLIIAIDSVIMSLHQNLSFLAAVARFLDVLASIKFVMSLEQRLHFSQRILKRQPATKLTDIQAMVSSFTTPRGVSKDALLGAEINRVGPGSDQGHLTAESEKLWQFMQAGGAQ
jgi:hypothetical protein